MRVIVVGASPLGLNFTRNMITQGNEVILIEKEPEIAKELAESLDCTVINAEGTKPDILEKVEVEKADALVACTGHDQDNILIGLIARDANVEKVIVKADDDRFIQVAKKLGFKYAINPSNISTTIISDMLRGVDTIELSTLVRSDVRFMSVFISQELVGEQLSSLQLPKKSSFIGLYRKNDFILASEDPVLEDGDELIILTRAEHVKQIYDELSKTAE